MESTKAVPATAPRRVIKRYSNRKLYDTRDSRYVTLQQIGEMVRAGEEVQIIDNKTKEDKTEVTLALILSEDLKSQPRSVPLAALRDLIQERGGRLLSQLREGTLGRFIPQTGAAEDEAKVEQEPPPKPSEPPKSERRDKDEEILSESPGKAGERKQEEKKGRLSELMESSLSSLDERIRHIVPSARSFSELEEKVAKLSERIDQLERQLAEQKSSKRS